MESVISSFEMVLRVVAAGGRLAGAGGGVRRTYHVGAASRGGRGGGREEGRIQLEEVHGSGLCTARWKWGEVGYLREKPSRRVRLELSERWVCGEGGGVGDGGLAVDACVVGGSTRCGWRWGAWMSPTIDPCNITARDLEDERVNHDGGDGLKGAGGGWSSALGGGRGR